MTETENDKKTKLHDYNHISGLGSQSNDATEQAAWHRVEIAEKHKEKLGAVERAPPFHWRGRRRRV